MEEHDARPTHALESGLQQVHRDAIIVVHEAGTYSDGERGVTVRNVVVFHPCCPSQIARQLHPADLLSAGEGDARLAKRCRSRTAMHARSGAPSTEAYMSGWLSAIFTRSIRPGRITTSRRIPRAHR
jgi:hypothetical protein